MSIHNPSELIYNDSFNQETAVNPTPSLDNNQNYKNKLRNALIGIGSIGLVTSNLVPEIKLSNSGLSASYENTANAAVTVDGKKIIVSPDDIKNGLAFVDQNYETHKPTPDFLSKYKNISDQGINDLIKKMVSQQKIQRISNLVTPPVKPEDYKDVADLTQEIVGELNSPKKNFNIDSNVVGNRPKDSTPPTVAGETKEPVNTTGKVIDTSPTGSFTKPAESPLPIPTPEVAETPVQVESKKGEKFVKDEGDKTGAIIGAIAGLGLLGSVAAGILYIHGREASSKDRDNESDEYIEEVTELDWDAFAEHFSVLHGGFGSDRDKKSKLKKIFSDDEIGFLSVSYKNALISVVKELELAEFESSSKLAVYIQDELGCIDDEIRISDMKMAMIAIALFNKE